MTPSLRELIADVLRPELDSGCVPDVDPLADALLADLTLAAIVTLAAFAIVEEWPPPPFPTFEELPTDGPLRVMLRDWRGDD